MEREGCSSNPTGQMVSHLKVNKMLSKGYLYHLVGVNDLEHEVPSIDCVRSEKVSRCLSRGFTRIFF